MTPSQSHRIAFAVFVAVTLSILAACGPDLSSMRRVDAYVTAAETLCRTASQEQKLSACRRALACTEPAKRAQHAVHDLLVATSKTQDTVDDHLAASAAYAGAVAACDAAGVKPTSGSRALKSSPPVGAATVPTPPAVPSPSAPNPPAAPAAPSTTPTTPAVSP